MNCNEVKDELGAFADKQLPAKTHSEIEAHITSCTACKNELTVLEKTLRQVDDWVINAPRIDIYGKIRNKIAKPRAKPLILRLSAASIAAALVAFILIKTIDLPTSKNATTTEISKKTEDLGKSSKLKAEKGDTPENRKDFLADKSNERDVTKELLAYYKIPSTQKPTSPEKKHKNILKTGDMKPYLSDSTKAKESFSHLFKKLESFEPEKDEERDKKKLAIEEFKSELDRRLDETESQDSKEDVNERITINHRKENRLNILDIKTPFGFFSVFFTAGDERSKKGNNAPKSQTVVRDGRTLKVMSYYKNGIQITIISHELSWEQIEQLRKIF